MKSLDHVFYDLRNLGNDTMVFLFWVTISKRLTSAPGTNMMLYVIYILKKKKKVAKALVNGFLYFSNIFDTIKFYDKKDVGT